MNSRNKKILVATIIVVFIASALFSYGGFFYSSVTSNYQGINPQFAGITYNGQTITSSGNNLDLSATSMRYINNFGDTSVFGTTDAYISAQLKAAQIVGGPSAGPIQTYTKTVTDPNTGLQHKLEVDVYKTQFSVTITMGLVNGPPSSLTLPGTWAPPNCENLDIWIKMQNSHSWNFQGADATYFGLAYLYADSVDWQSGSGYADLHHQNIAPASAGTALSIYNMVNGLGSTPSQPNQQTVNSLPYPLTQQTFGDSWVTRIHLGKFQPDGTWGVPNWHVSGPDVTVTINAEVFVVGDWTIKPASFQTQAPQPGTGYTNYGDAIANWFNSPVNQMIVAVVAIIAIAVVLFIFVPMTASSKSKAVKIIGLLLIAVAILAIISWVLGII